MMDQQTAEWFAARLGIATASNFKKVLATIKSGEASDRRNYRAQLVLERLTGERQESFVNSYMQWGTETEPLARAAYAAATDEFVEEVGFIRHPDLLAGCSPDGLIGDTGMIEIKCPASSTHKDTLLAGVVPAEHMPQVQGQLWICEREWSDFVSFDPRFPEKLQLFKRRVFRDDEYIKKLAQEVSRFMDEVLEEEEKLRGLCA